MTTTFRGRRTPMPRLTPTLQGWLPTLADLGVQPRVLRIPGIRRAALQPRLTRGRNWSRQCEARAAGIPNSRDTDSRSSPRSRRSTVARVRRAENRPRRSRSAAAPVALRALSAAVDSSTCVLISTLLLRELSRNPVSKKTLGRRSLEPQQ